MARSSRARPNSRRSGPLPTECEFMRHVFWAIACFLSAAQVSAADLRIDPVRSRAEFSVRLLWVSNVSGAFERIHGDVSIDHGAQTAIVRADIDTESIRMESARL